MKTTLVCVGALALLAPGSVSATQSNLRRAGSKGGQPRHLSTAEFTDERKAFFANLVRSETINFQKVLQQALEAQDPLFFPNQDDGYYYSMVDEPLLDLGTISSGPCQGQQAQVQLSYQRIKGHSSGALQSDASSIAPEDISLYSNLDCRDVPDGCKFDLYRLVNYTATNSNLELDLDLVFSTQEGNCPTSFGTARIVAPTANMHLTTKVVGTISLQEDKSEIGEYIMDASWEMDASTNITVAFHNRFNLDGHNAYDAVLDSTVRALTEHHLSSERNNEGNKLGAMFEYRINDKIETLPISAWEEDAFADFIQNAKTEDSISWWRRRLMAPIIYLQNVGLLTFWLVVNPDNFYY